MNIKYRIIEVHQKEHSFVVRFYTDLISEETLASQFNEDGSIMFGDDNKPVRCRTDYNITMYNEQATEEDIDNLIRSSAPSEWLRMQEENLSRTTDNMTPALGRALAKLQKEHVFEHQPPETYKPEEPKVLSEMEIEELLAMVKKSIINPNE